MSETKPSFIEKRLNQQMHQQEKDLKIQADEIIRLKAELKEKDDLIDDLIDEINN